MDMYKVLLVLIFSFVIALPASASVGGRQLAHGEVPDGHEPMRMTQEQIRVFQEKRNAALQSIREHKDAFHEAMEKRMGEFERTKEIKRGELQKRLTAIKDERKKQIVVRLYENINTFNKNRVTHFGAVADRLEEIVGNIKSRTEKAAGHSLNVNAVRLKITEAENVIASARAAIETQAAKIYTPVITTEAQVRLEMEKIRQTAHADLTKVRDALQAAHSNVRDAAVELGKINGVDDAEIQ